MLSLGIKAFVIFLYIHSIKTQLIYQDDENIKHDHIIETAIEIANQNFNFRIQTAIVSNDVDEEIVSKFIQYYRGTVLMEKRDGFQPKQVVLIIESYFSLVRILGRLKPDLKGRTFLHSGAYYLIVLLSYPHRLERINRFLWSYYATNVVILVSNKNKKIALYTYFPYKNPLSCQNLEPSLIGFWDDKGILQKNLFLDKMGNMHGCPLYISTNKLYHPATEQKVPLEIIKKAIVRLFRNAINFTPIISTRDYLSIDSDGAKEWSGTLEDVLSGASNISMCSISPGMERAGVLDYSIPYFRISLAWLAPPLRPEPIWWRLLTPLNGYLWLGLLLVICIVKSIPFIMKMGRVKKICYRNFKNADKLHGVVIRIWAVLMGQPIRVEPKRFRDFYILAIWIWFTFVVRSAYQSVLIGALKSEITIGKFRDLKEAVNEGYQFGGRAGVLEHFDNDPFIRDNFVVVPENEFDDLFGDVLAGKKKFIFAISLEYVFAYCMAQGINDNECGYVLPDSIMTIPLVIWMRKNSTFKRPLAIWLIRLIESGLIDKDMLKVPVTNTLKTNESSPLTIDQVSSCLLCLLLGYVLSTIIFIAEIVKFKSKQINIQGK
ncbi:jg5937 [Pararge aegeria aegeria]|uniref:Jg5937 protein n=1 Tax=Pararge aegeria aegeria TaxID=348720 RepID=A0A8S4RI68_9NEOP|nr:jg5937 [Pararge aegeria aegeria]